MIYLLDTCTVSDFAKGQSNILSRIKTTSPKLLGISSITRMEIEYGLKLNPQRAGKLAPVMNAFLSAITILPFSMRMLTRQALSVQRYDKKGHP